MLITSFFGGTTWLKPLYVIFIYRREMLNLLICEKNILDRHLKPA